MHLWSWVLLAFHALITCPILVMGGNTQFIKPQIRVTTTFADFNARIMDQWGGGGGKWVKISKDSKHPFEGRTFGGAKRKEIRGTRAFGSGYPYGATNQSTIARRHFPFGVWPLYWDQNFMDADEYGPQYDAIRPGGFLAIVPLRGTTEYFNVTDDEVYYAIGDRESLLPLMVSYVTWCHVLPAWPSRFDPKSPNATIKLENVIQYFRASSFALASPAYINTLARSSISDTKESTPLPDVIEYSIFRKCVDGVTANALAILNKPPDTTITNRIISGVCGGTFAVIGVTVAVLWILYTVLLFLREWMWTRLFPRQAFRAARRLELQYESYP